jgi:hypothetical protein
MSLRATRDFRHLAQGVHFLQFLHDWMRPHGNRNFKPGAFPGGLK